MLAENVETLLELRREQAKKKNKNVETSHQYELRKIMSKRLLIFIVSKLERNLIRICKVAPNTLVDENQAQANKNTLIKVIKKKQQLGYQ